MSKEILFQSGNLLLKILKSPMRTQYDILKLLTKTVQEILNPASDTKEINERDCDEGFRVVLPSSAKEKMQRIFFYNYYPNYDGKPMYSIQSLVFPFNVEKDENEEFEVFYNSAQVESLMLDSKILSQILAVLDSIDEQKYTWGENWVDEMMNLLFDNGNESFIHEQIFYMINELLVFDFGYLRFDNDPQHEDENHPIHHLDIHLDNKGTFKLGVLKTIDTKEFIEILDNNKRVRFIQSFK